MKTKWKYYNIGVLFPEIYKGIAYNAQDLTSCSPIEPDAIRYITRTDTNNGCKSFVINESFKYIEKGNAITIGDTTSTIYYQNEPFICGDHIVILRAPFLTEKIGLFIVTLLNKERFRYNYGRSFKMDIVKSTNVLLPSMDDENPDWGRIEYIINTDIIPVLPVLSKKVWNGEFNKKAITPVCTNFHNIKWNLFNVKDVFTIIEKCKCSNATELLEIGNDITYIGAKKSENGVMRYAKYDETLVTKGNCIVFIGDGQGSVGYSLYQPKDFIGSTTLVAGYNDHLNPYTALFLVTILDMERYRYSFGRKYNKNAILNSKIKLPVDSDGNPDWQFMEDYIKSLPYSANL